MADGLRGGDGGAGPSRPYIVGTRRQRPRRSRPAEETVSQSHLARNSANVLCDFFCKVKHSSVLILKLHLCQFSFQWIIDYRRADSRLGCHRFYMVSVVDDDVDSFSGRPGYLV